MEQWQTTEEGIRLDKLYSEIGLNTGKGCRYFSRCAASCKWTNREITAPTGAYIGEDYPKYRLLFIGINPNIKKSGNLYDCYHWISGPKSAISPYIDGAIHRCVQKFCGEPLNPDQSSRRFAFTNLVKCSVNGLAGLPTDAMSENCSMRLSLPPRELEILVPRVVVCLGAPPYYALLNHFIEDAVSNPPKYKPWLFTVQNSLHRFSVIRLFNPGQGYRNVRAIWKMVLEKHRLPAEWVIFNDDNPEFLKDVNQESENADDRNNMIDPGNRLYELMVEKLFALAHEFAGTTRRN